ncbi:4'-phosphopantetheinyl transferase family protein [Lentilitoribacter sp. EG35]|uniref:4'-phosphopantetheinyl transferase family protein n=1 Tax=Lentilitoribacter sp. EG35 TaxID=3234192 RepID=UPI00346123EB
MLRRMLDSSSILAPCPNRIDIWFTWVSDVRHSSVLANYTHLLSTEEKDRYYRFHHIDDRLRFLATRALVRTSLSRYSPIEPKEWIFTSDIYGRPKISSSHPIERSISFNISHTRELVALAITTDRRIGIDVEADTGQVAPLDIADYHFAPSEINELNALHIEERPHRFFEYWTLKEAYVKARGIGLSIPLNQFSFELSSVRQIKLDIDAKLSDDPARWNFWLFQADEKHVLAICTSGLKTAQEISFRHVIPLLSERFMEARLLRISASLVT